MILGAKALAFLRGRDYAVPSDARDLARDVLRHRIVLSYEGLADGVTPDDLLGQLLEAVSMPDIPMRERTGGGQAWSTSRR
jgi:MoxR-like ATPase